MERAARLRVDGHTADDSERTARARATGRGTFMGIDLEIGAAVPVPRRETEALAVAAITWLDRISAPTDPWVIDPRCGAGHLACAFALALPHARVWACDVADDAVRCAARNVQHHGLAHRVDVRRGELSRAVSGLRLEGQIDAVVCGADDAAHDPRADASHARLLDAAAELLGLGGRVYFELHESEHDALHALVLRHGAYEWLDCMRDDAGRPRVAIARRTMGRQGPRASRSGACAIRSETGFACTSSATSTPRPLR